MVKESAAFIAGSQARSPGQPVLKRPEGFQGKVYKDRVREGVVCGACDQLVGILLIGW